MIYDVIDDLDALQCHPWKVAYSGEAEKIEIYSLLER